jgi:hypothetical protein
MTGERAYSDGARRALDLLRRLQDCATANANVRGGIKGSHPIWGRYLFGTFPNWAAKFFMDAVMVEDAVRRGDAAALRGW